MSKAGVNLLWGGPPVGGFKSHPRAPVIRSPKLLPAFKGDSATRQPTGYCLRTASRCSRGDAAGEASSDSGALSNLGNNENQGSLWSKWKANTAEMSSKMAELGLAAVLAYGLFDGVTYTTFFILAFLGYEKSTGNNPAANLKALLGIVILMWTGNNVTRPFRVAGAAALAPAIDKLLKKMQTKLNLPSQMYAFALVVGVVAGSCLSVVGLLILSRWGK